MSSRTVEIIVDVRDATKGKLESLKKQLDAMDKQAQRLSNRFKSFGMQKYMATLRLIDNVTAPASRINNLLKKIAGGVYNITMRINDAALGGLRKIESTLQRIVGKVYPITLAVKGNVMNKLNGLMSGAAMGAGMFMPVAGMAGVGFGVANAIQASAGFEKQMSQVQAIRQLSKDSAEMKALTQQAKDLGMTTAWTRQQAGEAMYYQALAGWDTKNILATTPHILNLASAANMDLGRASDIVTDTMTAFNLKPTDTYVNKQGKSVNAAEHYIDLLAKLQASSNTTVEQAYGAMKYSANQIGALTMNLQGQERVQAAMENATDAAVMTALMANAGIKESMGGTGISNIAQRMTSGNRNAYYALGLTDTQIEDAGHNLLSFEKIIKQLNKSFHEGMDIDKLATFVEEISGQKIHADTRRKLDKLSRDILENGGKMGTADAMQLATMIGGAEHAHKLLALIMGDWDAMEKKLTEVDGTAEKMSKDMLDNLAGSFKLLGSAWDAFQQDLFTGTAGNSLRGLVDTMTEILTRANKLFKDGIDIGDFGQIIADVVDKLKNKFMQLDGIGSLLAGGALVAGLMKIISLSQRAFTALKTMTQPGAWSTVGAKGTGGAGLGAGAKVGTMTVSAGVVNVNGKVAGGAGGAGGAGNRKVGNTAIIDNYNRTKEHINAQAAMRSNAIKAGIGGAAFAGIFSLLDIMNVKSANAERLAAATTAEERTLIARENRHAEWQAAGGGLGSVVGAAIGAGLGSFAGPLGTAIGGVVGGMLGDAVGRWLGDKGAERETVKSGTNLDVLDKEIQAHMTPATPPDYSFGQTQTNKTLESFATFDKEAMAWSGTTTTAVAKTTQEVKKIEQDLNSETEAWIADFKRQNAMARDFTGQWRENSTTQDYFKQQRDQWAELSKQNYGAQFSEMLSNLFSMNKAHAAELTPEQMTQQAAMEQGTFYPAGEPVTIPAPTIEPMETSPIDEWFNMDDIIARVTELGTLITEGLSAAMEGAGEVFNGLGETIGTAMETASSMATSALDAIQSAFTSAKDTVQAAWGELPGFFAGVFGGLGGAAEAAGSAIYSGLTAVIGGIIGAWQSAAATISGIISSISATASSVSATVSGVIARVTAHADGGFVTSPEVALIGERGAELVLPLTNRERSLELLNQASSVLGLNSEGDGYSISGGSSGGENSSGGITINVGGISFEVHADNIQELENSASEKFQELADKLAAHFSEKVSTVFKNQTLVA